MKVKWGKLSRREGIPLHPKAEKILARRSYAPGVHGITGGRRRRKTSPYGDQLREKQKVKRIFGITETQFRNYFDKAAKIRGVTGEVLLSMLELRLDNVVFRLRFAPSRPAARQLISHGHITVNGRKVSLPGYQVRPADVVAVGAKSQEAARFKALAKELKSEGIPVWLSLKAAELTGKVEALPTRGDIEPGISEQMIIEFYSR